MTGKLFKRIVVILLALCLCIGMIPVQAGESFYVEDTEAAAYDDTMYEAAEEQTEAVLPVLEMIPEEVPAEEPAVEEPVYEEPVYEEPVVEEPAAEEPAIEEPVYEEPAAQEPAAEEPVYEEPAAEEPAAEEPAAQEPAVEEPAAEEPVVEEPAAEEPAVEEPAEEEPAVEEPAAEEPVVEEPAENPAEEYTANTKEETLVDTEILESQEDKSEETNSRAIETELTLNVNEGIRGYVNEYYPELFVQFVPQTSGKYVAYSTDGGGITGTLYDSEGDIIICENYGPDGNFKIVYDFTADVVYYIGIRLDENQEGYVDLCLEYARELTSLSVSSIEILENTQGYMTYDDYWDGGQHLTTPEYFRYVYFDDWDWDTQSYSLTYSFTYNGTAYTGDQTSVYEITGEWPSITTDQSYNNQWTAGNTYHATVTLLDKSCDLDVTILPSPITSLTVAPIQIIENTHGNWTYDGGGPGGESSPEYFCYNSFEYELNYTVVYNGVTYTGNRDVIERAIGEWPSISYGNQSYESQWTVGGTYKATALLMGKRCEFNVTIVPSPLASISVAPIMAIENARGYWTSDSYWDGEQYVPTPEFFRYAYFDDYWDSETQSYPLQYTFTYNGTSYTGDRRKVYEITGEYPSISTDQSYNNQWTVGNTYQATVTLLGKSCNLNVTIVPNPLSSISVSPIEIIENTHGYWTRDGGGPGGEEISPEYYYYQYFDDWDSQTQSYPLQYTFTYNGTAYTGDRSKVYEITGEWPSISTYQSYNNQWTVGHTYQATVTLLGKSCDLNVTILPSPLTSISVAPIQIIENTQGYMDYDYYWDGEQGEVSTPEYFRYAYFDDYWDSETQSYPLQYTFTYNGTAYTGDRNKVYEITEAWPSISTNQSYNNQWTVGNTYQATVTVLGKSCDLNVTIVPSPLTSISVAPIQIVENTHGYMTYDSYKDGEQGTVSTPEYYRYEYFDDWDSQTQSYPLQYTFTYNGQEYTGDRSKVSEITGESPSFSTDQSYNNQWTVGNTYQATVTLLGKSCNLNVTIVPSPLTSISVAPIEIIENTHGYMTYDNYKDGEQGVVSTPKYYYYWYFDEWDSQTQSYPLQYTFTYNGQEYTGDRRKVSEITGETPTFSTNQSYNNQWAVGGTYQATVTLMGKSCDMNVTIVPSPLTSISVAPIEIIENTHGYMTYDNYKDGEQGVVSTPKYYRYENLDDWDPQTQSYSLQYTFTYNGTEYTGDREKVYEITGERPTISTNQSYNNQWVVGGTYQATVTVLGKSCDLNVTIVPSPLTSFSASSVQIIENTLGRWTTDPAGNQFYYYMVGQYDGPVGSTQLLYTIVYDGVTYTGTSYDIYQITGASPSVDSSAQTTNHWTAGHHYTATATLGKLSCEIDVEIIPTPVEEFYAEPMYVIEGTCGYPYQMSPDPTDIQYVYYLNQMPWQFATVSNGIISTGSAADLSRRYGYSVTFTDYSTNPDQWTVGNTYTATCWFMGKSTTVEIHIVPSPVTDFTVDSVSLEEMSSEELQYGNYYLNKADITCELTYNGTFSGTLKELEAEYGYTVTLFNYYSREWTVGNTYQSKAYFMGKCAEFDVTIVPDSGDDWWELSDDETTLTIHVGANLKSRSPKEVPWYAQRESITTVVIEPGVKKIFDYAFAGCTNLTEVEIPDSVTSIGYAAFEGCSSLSVINIPPQVTTIDYSSFRGCSAATSLSIPDSVTTITYYSFQNCTSLEEVTLPKSVKNIYAGAFDNCSSITDVYYGGSESERYTNLSLMGLNDYLVNATWHYALKDISQSLFILSQNTYSYTGAACTPDVVVNTYTREKLVEDTDYTISYLNNVQAGIATVVVTGIGDYGGVVKIPFYINGFRSDANGDRYFENGVANKTEVIKGTINGVSGWWNVVKGKVEYTDTVAKNSNGWFAIRNGKVDFSYTGFASNANGDFYCENGKVWFDANGIIKGTVKGVYGYWYVQNSRVIYTDTLAKNSYGWWAIRNGQVDFDYNGFASNANGDFYCEDGKVNFDVNGIVKGTVKGELAWWYVQSSRVIYTDTLAKNSAGWWAIRNGKIDFNYTGFASNANGDFYCENGKVYFDVNGIVKGTVNDVLGWWYVENSRVIYTDTVAKNSAGWWAIRNGQVDFDYTGFASNANGDFYCEDGKVTFNTTSVIKGTVNGVTAWWNVVNSRVIYTDTVAKNKNGWFAIINGKVDFSFTGILSNSYGYWYCVDGMIAFDYSGRVVYKGKTYRVSGGSATLLN